MVSFPDILTLVFGQVQPDLDITILFYFLKIFSWVSDSGMRVRVHLVLSLMVHIQLVQFKLDITFRVL